MKKITTMALVSVLAVSIVGCRKAITGLGPYVAENRSIENFNGIELLMNGDIYYSKGNNRNLEIVAQQNILDNLQTLVLNDKLIIKYRNDKSYDADETIRINITAPEVNDFELKSSGSIYSLSNLAANHLILRNNGSGSISLRHVAAGNIEAIANASGNIVVLDGETVNENARTSGSGKIDLSGILARTATVRTSGSGKILVKVADHLHATIEGSGSIYYGGYPDVSSHISGTGHLVHF
jgi:hypothetical protein